MKRPGIGAASDRPPKGGGGVTSSGFTLTPLEARLAAEALSIVNSQRVSSAPATDDERSAWALEYRLTAWVDGQA